DEDPVAAHLKKIGAFNIPDIGVGMLKKNAAVNPLRQRRVLRFVDVDDGLAAFVLVEVAAADEKGFSGSVENERVAPFVDFPVAVESLGKDRIAGQFAPVDEVVIAESGPLLGMVPGGTVEGDAGVEDHRLSVAVDRAATGPDALLLAVGGGTERNGEALPISEIAAANVAPVFWAVAIAERIELIKQVVPTVVIDGAIGIVHPLGGSSDMKNGMPGISLGAGRGRIDGRLGARAGVRSIRSRLPAQDE